MNRIAFISDIHVDFGELDLSKIDSNQFDILVIAGDIGLQSSVISTIKKFQVFEKPIVFVLGNHDYVGDIEFNKFNDLVKYESARLKDVYFLNNDSVVINGINFIGATLWTDFKLNNNQEISMYQAKRVMLEYRKTYSNQPYIYFDGRPFLPTDVLNLNEYTKYFFDILDKDKSTVVVTHHAPSEKSIEPCYKGDELNPAFACNMESFILNNNISLWIHGHTHYDVDYMIGNTRVVANQLGYNDRTVKLKIVEL